LLEKGFGFVGWGDNAREIVEIVFAPGLAYFGFAQGFACSISHGVCSGQVGPLYLQAMARSMAIRLLEIRVSHVTRRKLFGLLGARAGLLSKPPFSWQA
jgi:hypothetical protein